MWKCTHAHPSGKQVFFLWVCCWLSHSYGCLQVVGEASHGSLLPGNNLSWGFPHLLGPRCAPLCFLGLCSMQNSHRPLLLLPRDEQKSCYHALGAFSLKTVHFCCNVLREGRKKAYMWTKLIKNEVICIIIYP